MASPKAVVRLDSVPAWTIAFGLLFLLLAWAKTTQVGRDVDLAVLTALQSDGDSIVPRGPDWLLEAFRDLTALGSLSVLA